MPADQHLNPREFSDIITDARDAAAEEMQSHNYPSGRNCGKSIGGCGVASEVVLNHFEKRGIPARLEGGVVLNERDEYVESGPDYVHSRGDHEQEYRARPDMKYSRAELDSDEGLREQYDASHVWVRRTDTDTIVDATADQFGGFGPTIAKPGTPEHRRYYRVGEWD